MKKLVSLLLALVMVLGLATVAAAEATYDDAQTVTITKKFKLIGAGISPEATFQLEQYGDGAVKDGDAASAPALAKISDVNFDKGAATAEGAEGTFTITLPTYEKVGVYEYTLRETSGNLAGVTYFSGDIKLVVTVIEQDGLIRVAAVHTETPVSTDPNLKSDEIANTYSAGSLQITKTVTGNMGDKTKYFDVTVTLTGETSKTYAESYGVTGGSHADNPETIEIGAPTTFKIKDGDTITIGNLPYGVTYDVEEADYTGEGYADAVYNFTDEAQEIDSVLDTVTITNNKDAGIDTGVTLDAAPYFLLLALAAVGMFLLLSKKRFARD